MSKPDLELARAAYLEIGKALDSGDFQPPESNQWFFRVCNNMDKLAEALGLSVTAKPTAPPKNESILALSVGEVLTQWDAGLSTKAEFENKMRETICHFARVYIPDTADLEPLKLVAKLAYQHKFRLRSTFIGGTKITPFWEAIDALPSNLLNEAHREMADEIEEMKRNQDRLDRDGHVREDGAHHSTCIGDCTKHSDGTNSCIY